MKNFMKKHKLQVNGKKLMANSKRVLALLLAVAMVTGNLPASTAHAAENDSQPAVEAEEVTVISSGDVDVVEEVAAEAGSNDGQDANLDEYSLDISVFEEYMRNEKGFYTVAEYGSEAISWWTSDWRIGQYVYVLKNGARLCTLNNLESEIGVAYTTKWQVKDGEEFKDTTAPNSTSAVGLYQLVVEIPEVAEKSKAMSAPIAFEITKAVLEPDFALEDIEPGTLAREVKDAIKNFELSYKPYGESTVYFTVAETDSQVSLAVEIIDCYTNKVLGTDDVLLRTGDYNVKITPSFTDKVTDEDKAKYALPVIEQKLNMTDLIETEIAVTMTDKWIDKNNTPDDTSDDTVLNYTVEYTGQPISAPVAGTDYSMLVRYQNGTENGQPVYEIITPAEGEVTYAWYSSYSTDLPMESAPVNAGTYYYGIEYAGKAGLYQSASYRMTVVVEPKELTLVPKWKDGAQPTIYQGMSAADVLDYVDYVALDKNSVEVDIDKDHIWGNYFDSNKIFSYEPVFKVQLESTVGENKVYNSINDYTALVFGSVYRVAFNGDKSVHYLDGGEYPTYSINDYTGSANSNYKVNVTTETLEARVLPVTVTEGTAVVVKVDAMLRDGAGATYDKPITKTYDGANIYAERAEYKLAQVVEKANESSVIASNTDDTLTYTWYYMSGTRTNDEGAEVPVWSETYYRNSPVNAGTYKLVITYKDPANEHYAVKSANAYGTNVSADEHGVVYFKIDPLKIRVVPKVVPHALTETAVNEYDYSAIEYEIQTLDGVVLDWVKNQDYYMYPKYAWLVEQKDETSETGWSETSWYGDFTKDKTYRIGVEGASSYFRPYSSNYTDYEIVEKTVEGETTTYEIVYWHDKVTLDVDVMGSTELVINVDETKLTTDTKEYDGERWNLSEDIKNGLVKVAKKSDGAEVTDVELDYRWYNVDEGESSSVAPYEVGEYELYASFAGNTSYHSVDEVKVATLTITKADLMIIPAVDEPVVAATYYSNVLNLEATTFEGVAERDASYFQYQYYYNEDGDYYTYGIPAISYYNLNVRDAEGERINNNLDGAETYTLTMSCGLADDFAKNYNIRSKEVSFTTVRGNSAVYESDDFANMESIALSDSVVGMDHYVKPVQAIPYSYYVKGEREYCGNFMAICIRKPAEFDDEEYEVYNHANYESSLYAAGAIDVASSADYIYALFDASAMDAKTFSVSWEPGYVENFTLDFANAVLLGDLANAVDAKSMSLISPAKKMVVGDEQQLDVKLTKKQMNDIIALGYTVDNADVLCVTSNGYITALKPGKATVTVWCGKYDYANEKLVPIEGAKTTSVTITVSDVSVAKVKSVNAWDVDASVSLAPVKDGYRVEGYVLEGKNVPVSEFESRIAAMENQHWSAFFASAPDYTTWYGWGLYFTGLKPNTEYTVYVRNVARVRTTSDGCPVSPSVNGSTKSFKTTKHQVKELYTYYDEKQPVFYNEDNSRYEVKLTAKKVTVSAYGLFEEKALNVAADDRDAYGIYLPLTKEQKQTYVSPKLTFFAAARTTVEPDKYYHYDGEYYYYATSRATMAKNGKMTLKAAGVVYVGVYDSVSQVWSEFQPLYITVAPDKITANKVSLQVGQSMSLTSMVTYYEGKTKLSGSFDRAILVTDELRKAFADSEYFELNGNTVTAIKAGGTLSNLTFTDAYCGASTTVSMKSTAMPAISSLKATAITDKYADMSFVYTGYANKFRIEVIDSRNRLIASELCDSSDLYDYTLKGKKYYSYRISGLTRQSAYTVQVTAIYDNEDGTYVTAKTVKKNIKTTKIPASYKNLKKDQYGGIDIYVTSLTDGNTINNQSFYTGNSYTLIAAGEGVSLNEGAKVSVSDTLTWTSTNKKVASVKAKAGTYTAELKALKSGYTTIEVKSKITKKVIARYSIHVYAVGNAYGYYGENEDLKGTMYTADGAAVQLGSQSVSGTNEGVYVYFTAPSSGTYVFQTYGSDDTYGTLYSYPDGDYLASNDDGGENRNFKISYYLDRNETVMLNVRSYYYEDFDTTLNISRQ